MGTSRKHPKLGLQNQPKQLNSYSFLQGKCRFLRIYFSKTIWKLTRLKLVKWVKKNIRPEIVIANCHFWPASWTMVRFKSRYSSLFYEWSLRKDWNYFWEDLNQSPWRPSSLSLHSEIILNPWILSWIYSFFGKQKLTVIWRCRSQFYSSNSKSLTLIYFRTRILSHS